LKSDKNETILIVDDTNSNIDILLELLKEYDLIVATEGEEALNIIETDDSIDLILLDIMMPKMDGFEVCEIIKKNIKFSSIPIIFLTAKYDEKSIEKAFEVGGIDYIMKPFKPIELLSRIKTHIKLIRQQNELALKDKYIALSDLIGNISHQWRQPLSVITTAISGMMMQKELGVLSDSDFEQYCQVSLDNCEYLSHTIEQFGVFLENKEKKYHKLEYLINTNLSLLAWKNDEKNARLIVDIAPEIECLFNDIDLLHIIQDLVNNAKNILKDKEEKLIVIGAKIDDDFIKLSIVDNGGGIDPAIIDKVFEPYFTTEHRSLGKGMNLFKIYSLVGYSLSGKITVRNREFEYNNKRYKGACFEITFPCN